MENKLTSELLEKAKRAKTPEELAALAKENGAELTSESAKTYFDLIHTASGQVADDELDQVSGGRKCGTIYFEGWPVVTTINSCDYYKNCDTSKWESGGTCNSCLYLRTASDDFLFVCKCKARYNN